MFSPFGDIIFFKQYLPAAMLESWNLLLILQKQEGYPESISPPSQYGPPSGSGPGDSYGAPPPSSSYGAPSGSGSSY